jgi:hypothetical protein
VLQIGSLTSGDIDLSGAIAPLNVITISLKTKAGVAGDGTITVSGLAVDARENVDLSNANNVNELAIQTTPAAGKHVSFRDVNPSSASRPAAT